MDSGNLECDCMVLLCMPEKNLENSAKIIKPDL